MLKIAIIAVSTAVLATIGSAGCASKGFVRTNVGEVRDSVESVSSSLEETQNQVQANAARLEKTSRAAENALTAADQAAAKAAAATEAAKTVQTQTDALEKARRKLLYDVVMNERGVGFEFDSAVLPDAVKKELDDLVAKLKQEPTNVFITIEGYADATGSSAVNERLGLERARAVERYLHDQHQIPLHKMEVVSYGEATPIAPNTTAAGRAENRRVEIKVLS